MATLDLLNDKISYLKRNSQDEVNRINNILTIVNSAMKALDNELQLKDYDFGVAINLVNARSYGLFDLKKSIQEIKNILVAKYDYEQSFLSIDEDHKQKIKSFRDRLDLLRIELEKQIDELSKTTIDENVLENLEDFKNLLEGKGRRKYYTYEMLEAFFQVFDYNAFSYSDMLDLVNGLSIAKNKGTITEEITDFGEITDLLGRYLGTKIKLGYLQQYQNEICSRIDLVNAKNILEFFKENNLLDRFSILGIIPIIVYGRYEYIKDFYFEKVLPKEDKIKELYYLDGMISVWINEGSSKRRRNTTIRKSREKSSGKSLYSTIAEVSDEDVWENVRIISENSDILAEKYDLTNISNIWAITKPTWVIKKNIELFRLFNISDVTLSALVQTDLEDKMHFAVELGLLNTPRTDDFRLIEKSVPRYQEFMLNGQKKKNNGNILNYFARNTSEIGKTSYSEYMYWFYKMQRSSKEEFYQDFFSGIKAGQRNRKDFYTDEDLRTIANSEELEKRMDNGFVSNYYDILIPSYDIYSEVIKDYLSSEKGDIIIPYYDESVLDNEIVANLEEHVAPELYTIDGELRTIENPYAYVFDKCIISRLKVLRNLSILKQKYGYLNEEMVLTAAVYNSFLSKEDFQKVESSIKGGAMHI